MCPLKPFAVCKRFLFFSFSLFSCCFFLSLFKFFAFSYWQWHTHIGVEMEFFGIASAGNGWKMKIADVYVNQQKELFFECNVCECDAECESLDELKHHIKAKHMTNQVRNHAKNNFFVSFTKYCITFLDKQMGARIQNRRESLFTTILPSMLDSQFHGKDHFNPVQKLF